MPADFVLSVRTENRRGRSRTAVLEEVRPLANHTLLIYIHGFGVSYSKAVEQWKTFRALLNISDDVNRIQAGVFLWPSDQYRRRLSGFPRTIEPAQQDGRRLGKYLAGRPTNHAVLVGHSLGGLVAVAAAEHLRGLGRLRGLVLLGAAIETSWMDEAGRYESYPYAEHEAVAFSGEDKMLARWFRYGQRAYLPFGVHAPAVGLTGDPASRGWHACDSRTSDHSYWKHQISAELTDEALGIPGRPGRRVPACRPENRECM
jgi:pimeloyl-ACP methyl ester carboxylesterase